MCTRACARTRTRGRPPQRTTFTVTVRTSVGPFVRISTARTRQVPTEVPRTLVPANLHLPAPDTMLRRSLPCDPRGIDSPVAPAMRAAVTVRPRRTVSTPAGPPVRATAGDLCTATVVVVGSAVVVDVVLVASSAGCTGDTGTVEVLDVVVLDVVLLVLLDDVLLEDAVVVLYTAGSEATLTGAVRCAMSPVPSWPNWLSPQHCTVPVFSTAHVCNAPAATSLTVPPETVTAAGV